MASNGGRQPTISKFFAPKNKPKNSIIKTDAQSPPKKKCKVAEIAYSPPLKRSTSFSSSEESSPKRSKPNGASFNGNGLHSPKPNSNVKSGVLDNVNTSPSSRSKLESFRFKGEAKKEESPTTSPRKISPKVSKGKGFVIPKGAKLTPLEAQVVKIKEDYPDTLLFVECGYKYRFFGEDADVAAKELNIVAHLDHNFQTASIPTHRLHIHVRRLVAKGYKVGVVKQTETAALKAIGSNKTAPFSRELSSLYTKATLIGEDVSSAGGEDAAEGTTSVLMVLTEVKATSKKEDKTGIALVSIQPTTGDVTYDTFEDSPARTSLWGRLEQIQPVEVILSQNVSDVTKKAIQAVMTRHEDCIRLESLPEAVFEYSPCLQSLCQLYEGNEDKIRHLTSLPGSVISCLGATLHYLIEFKLERILKNASDIKRLSLGRETMSLPGPTLRNLEVIVNSADRDEKGSLFWVLNQTQTKFGARVLRNWLVQPLLSIDRISERHSSIEELISSDTPPINALKALLNKLPDIEKSITTIFYKKCSPFEFWSTASSLSKVQRQLASSCGPNVSQLVQTPCLLQLINTVVDKLANVHEFAENIDVASAKENKKNTLFKDWSEFGDVLERQKEIRSVEIQLQELKPQIARTLLAPSFDYTTVSGLEYLIEVKNNKLNSVPSSWAKISSTKTCCRFRSKEVEKLFTRLQQLREQHKADCHQAWMQVLERFSDSYQQYREAVKCLGSLDALLSMAKVAQSNGYCKPDIVESGQTVIEIKGGKHPIVQQLRGDSQFVTNDTDMRTNGERVMLVTGPNMGGKSCYMRQVALISLMAQVGSYVPAQSAKLSILDGIYTRMGATDEIFSGRSSLMVEIGETADIMRTASDRSLVILDELGRGTSTHDGVAIATASLEYFLKQIKCLTIFVTHYLTLCEYGDMHPEHVGNHHMSFLVNEEGNEDDVEVITFLYQLTSGNAGQSYGLNVARLADVPASVLKRASFMSKALHTKTNRTKSIKEAFKSIFSQPDSPDKENLVTILAGVKR